MDKINNESHTIRWGIVGAGRIARSFAQDIQGTKSARLVAIASRSKASADEFALEYDAPLAFSNYDEMFASNEIDAVYIATPHTHHKEQAIAALRAGKHVLCEKPATVSLAELEALIEVAKCENRYFMEGMWTYFLPVIKKAQQWIEEGRIGTIRHIRADFGFHIPYDPTLREYNKTLGGGCLLEIGIYPIAMAWLFISKEPNQQMCWSNLADNGVEDDVVVINRYDSDSATAQLSASYRCKLPNRLELIGDKGSISIPDYWGAREAKLYDHNSCVETFTEDREFFGFNHQIETVSRELLAGKRQPQVVTWQDSRAFQRQMANIKTTF